MDALQTFVKKLGAKIVDPAGEYYDDYYAVFFLDPDGLKLEGMKWGERTAGAKRTKAVTKRKAPARMRPPEQHRRAQKVCLFCRRAVLPERPRA